LTQPGEGTCGRGLHPTFTFEQEFNVIDQWTQVLRVPNWAVAPDSLMYPAGNNAQTTQRLCSFSAQTIAWLFFFSFEINSS